MLCVALLEVCKVQKQPGLEFGNKPHGCNLRRAITLAGSNPANTLKLRRTRCGNVRTLGLTGHRLGADFLNSSNSFHELCSRFQAPIRRSSSTSDEPTHSLSLYRSELRAKLRIDWTPEALL